MFDIINRSASLTLSPGFTAPSTFDPTLCRLYAIFCDRSNSLPTSAEQSYILLTVGNFIKKDNPFGLDQTDYPNGKFMD